MTELYRWDFGDLNNDIENLKFRPNMSKQEQIQYVKDAYSSKSVNYVIDSQGQNRRYRYAMVVRKTNTSTCSIIGKNMICFNSSEPRKACNFTRSTSEKTSSFVPPEGGLPLNDLFPEKLRNEDQQRIIQSHSEEENQS